MKQNKGNAPKCRRWIKILVWLVIIGIACYGALIGLVYIWEVQPSPMKEYDSILVLGAQVLPTGEPSVQLGWRLDKAWEHYQEFPCPIVVSGGMAGAEPRPEGDVMREYLIAKGVPQDDVFSDPVSKNTRQNLENGMAILGKQGCSKPLLITSDYHLARAMAFARDQGIEVAGSGSPCRNEPIFWIKNHGREALAWVKYWLNKYLGLNL